MPPSTPLAQTPGSLPIECFEFSPSEYADWKASHGSTVRWNRNKFTNDATPDPNAARTRKNNEMRVREGLPIPEKKQCRYSLMEHWICDHARTYVPVAAQVRQRKSGPSIKMSCPARYYLKIRRSDGVVEIRYNGNHNHELVPKSGSIRARVDEETRRSEAVASRIREKEDRQRRLDERRSDCKQQLGELSSLVDELTVDDDVDWESLSLNLDEIKRIIIDQSPEDGSGNNKRQRQS